MEQGNRWRFGADCRRDSLFTSTASLRNLVGWLTEGELQEYPTDFVANHLVEFFHHLSISTEHFASVYLLVYGITKIGLATGLLRGKLWAYPTALIVLGIFLCYHAYRFSHNHSVGLGLVSVLDLIIMVLVWRDYKFTKAKSPGQPDKGIAKLSL